MKKEVKSKKMKKVICIVALVVTGVAVVFGVKHVLPLPLFNYVYVTDDTDCVIYYPNYKTLDLVYGAQVPQGDDMLYCCAGAFTAECLDTFCHENIRCNHVSDGKLYEGSDEPICSGVFTFYDGRGYFDTVNSGALERAAECNGMGFCQILIIKDKQVVCADSVSRKFRRPYVFRALCEKEGKLCIVESKEKVNFSDFVKILSAQHVTSAIYLDMGAWSHACYRDNFGTVVETNSNPIRFASNWLVFRK